MDVDPAPKLSTGTCLTQSYGPAILLTPATPPAETPLPTSKDKAPEATACHSKSVNTLLSTPLSTLPTNRVVVHPVEALASASHRWVSRARGWGTSASSRWLSDAFASWRARASRAMAIEMRRRHTCTILASWRRRAALHRWSHPVVSTRKVRRPLPRLSPPFAGGRKAYAD